MAIARMSARRAYEAVLLIPFKPPPTLMKFRDLGRALNFVPPPPLRIVGISTPFRHNALQLLLATGRERIVPSYEADGSSNTCN